jgi:predicted transcriptional regulator
MRYISYNTDKRIKTELDVLAIAHQTPVESLVRDALKAHLDAIESDLRTEACTVGLDPEIVRSLTESCDRTGLSKSKAIHLCIKKYLEVNEVTVLKLIETT